MENNPVLVSVVIPNYNYSRFLKQRIESVLAQTFTDFEIILLDDASTDDSIVLLKSYYTNPHVSHLKINSVNSGSPFTQWKKGIELAQGKYIWIAESDDVAEPFFLEKAVSAMEDHQLASFCFLGSRCIDENGADLTTDFDRWTPRQLCRPSGIGVFDGKEYIEHNLYWRNYIYNASGVVFRKECFEQIEDLSCFSLKYSGDWLFWVEMARQGEVVEIYEKLNRFRLHGKSTTKKAVESGEGLGEDMFIVKVIECYITNISNKRKNIRHGALYKKIRRLKVSSKIKEELYEKLVLSFDFNIVDYFIERFNKCFGKIIPFLITCDNDRL